MPSVPIVGLQTLFPKSASTLSYWRANLHHLDDHRSAVELPATCEGLIIGAGYAGAATAYLLFKDDLVFHLPSYCKHVKRAQGPQAATV